VAAEALTIRVLEEPVVLEAAALEKEPEVEEEVLAALILVAAAAAAKVVGLVEMVALGLW
jgi:hypothetical protein